MADAAYSEAVMENNFVTKDAFDIQVRSIRERADSEVRVSDARFDRLEVLIARNLTEQRAIANEIKGELNTMNERFNGKIDVLSERIDKNLAQYEAIANDIKGDIKAVNARLDTQQTKFGWYLTIFGIIIAVVIATIQLWK